VAGWRARRTSRNVTSPSSSVASSVPETSGQSKLEPPPGETSSRLVPATIASTVSGASRTTLVPRSSEQHDRDEVGDVRIRLADGPFGEEREIALRVCRRPAVDRRTRDRRRRIGGDPVRVAAERGARVAGELLERGPPGLVAVDDHVRSRDVEDRPRLVVALLVDGQLDAVVRRGRRSGLADAVAAARELQRRPLERRAALRAADGRGRQLLPRGGGRHDEGEHGGQQDDSHSDSSRR
jgi:hypothetical protein